jgi:hypothetical protein
MGIIEYEEDMGQEPKPYDMLVDFVTGKRVANIGAEEKRQLVERFLVEVKGFDKDDIEVDAELAFSVGGLEVRSNVDLVVRSAGRRFMVLRCVPGSLVSRERETLAAARVLDDYEIPFAVVTDGSDAEVLDTATGEVIGRGMAAIPSKEQAGGFLEGRELHPLPREKLQRERIIYRSYDLENVNVQRKLPRD